MTATIQRARRSTGWRAFIVNLFTPPSIGRELDRARARASLIFTLAYFLINLSVVVAVPFVNADTRLLLLAVGIPNMAITIFVYFLLRTGRLRAAFVVLSVVLCISYTPSTIVSGGDTSFSLLAALPLIYAGFTLGVSAMLAVDIFIIGVFGLVIYVQFNYPGTLPPVTPGTIVSDALALPLILIILTALVALLVRVQERTLIRNEQIASQLRAAAQLSQATLSTLDLNTLLQRSIDYIRDQFGFYHAQVFLVDPAREYAVLAASTGDAGAALLARGHRLAVGSKSVIGQVTKTGQPFITEDTADDPVHRPNDLLPNTRAEMAIPLLLDGEVIGALDVQSTRPNVFNSDDVDSLRIVAAQMSSAIRNAQLFTEQSATAEQNNRLLTQAEGNLREIEQLNQRLTSAAWSEYVKGQQSGALGVTIQNGVLQRELLPPTNHQVPAGNGSPTVTALPLIIGGRSIGTIEVELPPNARQEETIAIVRAVADRLVFSLENARLLEQSQALVRQESTVNLISTRMQTATTINDLLRVTLSELGQALGAQQALIRLTTEEGVYDEQ